MNIDRTSTQGKMDDYVDAYEMAYACEGPVSITEFLPPPDHPLRVPVLTELIRVEMEFSWDRGSRQRVESYRHDYPELFANRDALAQVLFEEFRLRFAAGEAVTASQYEREYGLVTSEWQERVEGRHAVRWGAGSDPLPPAVHPFRNSPFAVDPCQVEPEPVPAPDPPPKTEIVEDLFADRRLATIPQPGGKFLEFRLVSELGRGAFARVFLARQPHLANRHVVLKIAAETSGEPLNLAQLQHTNIVPIYSFHRSGHLQAVCMPYFGSTTLEHLLDGIRDLKIAPSSGRCIVTTLKNHRDSTQRPDTGPSAAIRPDPPCSSRPEGSRIDTTAIRTLSHLSYIEAVLWLGVRLADGLQHAHEQGIIHRDIKPANILLADSGQPMLLDFNLSEDTKVPADEAGVRVGGTLPYMAPEQLAALCGAPERPDGRCDIYALGVILYTLLTGRHPFPQHSGTLRERAALQLADRAGPPPSARIVNAAVSPAMDAIVRRCLEPDVDRRYHSASQLKEDLECQLAHLPLRHTQEPSIRERARKWAWRHPRVTSAATIMAASLILLGVLAATLVVREQRLAALHARNVLAEFRDGTKATKFSLYRRDLDEAELNGGIRQCRANLDRYGVLTDPDWQERAEVRRLSDDDRRVLLDEVGEQLFLLARAGSVRAEHFLDGKDRQRGLQEALEWNVRARAVAADRFPRALRLQRAKIVELQNNPLESSRLRAEAEASSPPTALDSFLLGHEYAKQGQYRKALPLLKKATQQDPDNFSAWFVRANCHHELGQTSSAAECLTACVALRPDFHHAWHSRGLIYFHLKLYDDAHRDFDEAIRLKPDFPDAYLNRALARQASGDLSGAVEDFSRALERGATTRVYFMRSATLKRLGAQERAAADRAEGLRHQPTDELGWITRAEFRAEEDPVGALADVEQALRLKPFSATGLQLKAHLLSEAGRDRDAITVLNRAVELHPDRAALRAGRGVLLARQGDRVRALEDARAAVTLDSRAPNLYQVSGIYALTSKVQPDDRIEALGLLRKALRTGFGLDLVARDSDLDPIRADPEFTRIVREARAFHSKFPATRAGGTARGNGR